MTAETVTLWVGAHGPYVVKREREWIDVLETSRKVRADLTETISRLLRGLVVGECDPADRDALIDAIISRFGSSSVAAYA